MKNRIVNLLLLGLAFFLFAGVANAAPKRVNKANATHHTVTGANPVKRLGSGIKGFFVGLGRTIDGAIIDPAGRAIQMFADGLDMTVAAPLEAMPEPFETLGDGVHLLYRGIDKVGTQLAK